MQKFTKKLIENLLTNFSKNDGCWKLINMQDLFPNEITINVALFVFLHKIQDKY